jgi:hypothetical protein
VVEREQRRKEREAEQARLAEMAPQKVEEVSLEDLAAAEQRTQPSHSPEVEVPEEDRADRPMGNFERSERDTAPVDSDEPENPDPNRPQ